jgi:NAD-dependent DNA ligase
MKGREEQPIYLDSHSAALRLIQLIRDETHRTAVTYHRKRRELRDFTSELTAIPGVGERRKNKLLRNLGSIQKIAQAGREELAPFVGRKTAEEIVEHFRRQRVLAEGGQASGVGTERAGDEAEAAREQDEHDDGVEEAGGLEVDLQVHQHAHEDDDDTRERQKPARD